MGDFFVFETQSYSAKLKEILLRNFLLEILKNPQQETPDEDAEDETENNPKSLILGDFEL